ncbi:MAG TPA: hypothetical protein PLZ51_05675 [Aggregatilineales bacterium]|nr:hypothetical protein [Aggregatilineales bacterium]
MNKKFVFVGILLVFVLSLMVGAVSAQEGNGRGGGRGGGNRPAGDGLRDIIQVVVDATGLEQEELLQQLRDGAILADLITANGGSVDAVIAEALAVVTEQTNQAVTDGKITQERADEILANAETRITELVNTENPIRNGLGGRGGGERGNRLEVDRVFHDALEEAGVTRAEIRAQLQDGASLHQILTDAGLDVATLTSEALANAQTRLDEAVANERLTAEEAATRLTELEARITELLDKTRTAQQQDI